MATLRPAVRSIARQLQEKHLARQPGASISTTHRSLALVIQQRDVHVSSRHAAQFSFDTAHFVNRLEGEGLSRKQALGIMEALQEVVEESVRTMTANLVTKSEQEKHRYTQKVDFQRLKSEITLLEKQDFSLLKSENEKLLSDVERLKQRLREEVAEPSGCCRPY